MNKYQFVAAVAVLIASISANAQGDPCAVINPKALLESDGSCYLGDGSFYSSSPPQRVSTPIQLQAHTQSAQLDAQRQLTKQFAELVAVISSLKQSIDNLNVASAELKASNETWRAATLEEAMRGIRAIPLAVAREPALQEAVGNALLSDPQFVDRLRTALAK